MKTNSNFKFAFFENKYTPLKSAKVSIMTNALQYGTGIFGGIRGYFNQQKNTIYIFRIEDHYNRFLSSLNILGVKIDYELHDLIEITSNLVKKNKPNSDIYFRPFAYAGGYGISPNLNDYPIFAFSVYMIPLGDYISKSKGLNTKVTSFRRIGDNSIPSRAKISGGYINSALARAEAAKDGYDEAIFLTEDGHVCEGSAENIFIVRDNILITPPISDNVLEGITRKSVMQIAIDMGIEVVERSIDRSELYIADELFFSGTAAQLAWIESVDRRQVNNGKEGKITAQIREKFFRIVRGQDTDYETWLTKIQL
jgi:branched-chain amino acid aminotransferase